MTSSRPRVTVFIPAYNAQTYIAEAMQSVLDQAFADVELLVIDDCSTDETWTICQRFASDPRVRLERMPRNRSRPVVRNRGLALARGDYLALLDADDRCLPGRLAQQVAYLDRYPDIDVLATRWQGMDARGRPLKANQNVGRLSPDTVKCYLLFRGIIHNPTVMVRREAIAAYAYDPAFAVAEDYDLWARMIPHHRFAMLADRLTAYRIYAEQASSARAAESRARRCDIQARELAALGLTFTNDDVRRHNLLYTGNRLFQRVFERPMDARDARWAADWVTRIIAANAESGRFPEPALSRLCARLLANVCRKARPRGGIGVWRALYQAGLGGALAASLVADWKQALVRSPGR
ncbi:glycosyltransferase family 2 protein [Salinisphaera sp. Q1T1-3]|uniref:glycosyltransferase family 2 protein n=1 Tax=Salinisphaera sp. Q1T1-3 TaxID=2321229 RepID=UPI000E736E55|nr:glycosyltransferase family 2 protein [Salinisphaera sp. Q1T1-3]RJS94689.1 glycosyltransferase family 2 protein [Salinisphaera sp. Q1T1-3]